MMSRRIRQGSGAPFPYSYGFGLLLLCVMVGSGCGGGADYEDEDTTQEALVETGPEDTQSYFTLDNQGPLLTEVHSFRVSPPVIHARVGDTFWVGLIPLDRNSGHYSDLDPSLTWEKPNRVWIEDGFQGAWISVRPSAAAGVSDSEPIPIIGKTSDGVKAELRIVLPSTSGTNSTEDWIEPNLNGAWPAGSQGRRARPVFALIDAEGQNGCDQDQRFAFGWGGFLGENKTEGCQPEGAEIALFSALGGSLLQEDPENSGAVFTSSQDRLTPALSGPTEVSLALWDWGLPERESYREQIKEDLNFAQTALDRSGVGIRLAASFPTPGDGGPPDGVLVYPGSECEGDLQLDIDAITKDAAKDTSVPLIHVIYAHKVLDNTGDPVLGATCDWQSSPLPVILIDRTQKNSSILAHELGHVFGLNGRALRNSGHTNNVHGFDPSNLMGAESSGPSGNREIFTLGQVYRMHFDPRSWLWNQNPAPDKPRRCCQGSPYTEEPCPPMWIAAWAVEDPAKTHKNIKSLEFEDKCCPGGDDPCPS